MLMDKEYKCIHCGKVKKVSEFLVYGGAGHEKDGECTECLKTVKSAKEIIDPKSPIFQ